jgi:hypothetical protein
LTRITTNITITDGVIDGTRLLIYSTELEIIIANVIATVNTPIELQIVFYRWYVIFFDGYIDRQIKTPMVWHTVFLWYVKFIDRGNNGIKWVIFFCRALSVYKPIDIFITDGLTDST